MRKCGVKRILSILQAVLICCLLVLPGRAYAQSGSTGGLSWSLSGGTLRISGSGAMPNYTDGNMPPWYNAAGAINRIIVDEGVTSIGSLAFYGCSTAALASLPSTVTSIGDRAFKNCTSLSYVSPPQGLKSIGEAAFESCETLNGIVLPNSLETIENYAFERCTSLTNIVIPAGVTDLGMVVFYNCTGLTRAEIQCPIDEVPDWFFYGCTSLSVVSLPETVEKTGDQAFHDCENLNTVYYTGTASEDISNTLQNDDTTRFAEVNNDEAGMGSSASTTTYDSETDTSTTVTVTQTEEAVITETTTTNYTYTVNGESSTLEDAMSSAETEEVEVTTETSSTISATVSGSGGWEEVADVARDAAVSRSDGGSVDVDVQMTDSTVNGRDLANLVGVDADLTISTNEGCAWEIQTDEQTRRGLGAEDIDLSFSVDLLEKPVAGIESETVYQVGFVSDITFESKVGIPLKVANTRQYATLFEKTASGIIELTSVVVDENGYAWFPVEKIDQQKDYFVAINEEKADTANAIVPDSMAQDYGVDHEETLTDASGKKYQVGERESRWGITGKQFTIYAVIVIAAIVLIVTGVMITLNKISHSKAKYAAMAAADAADYDIDEEELRLQIMQEMLEEAKRKGSAE